MMMQVFLIATHLIATSLVVIYTYDTKYGRMATYD